MRGQERPLVGAVEFADSGMAIEPGCAFRFDGDEVRAVGEDVGGLRVVEAVVGIVDGAAVGGELKVGQVAEGAPWIFDEIVNWPELAYEAERGGKDAQCLPGLGGGRHVVITAVADGELVPVVGEVEDAVNGAGDGGPHHVHTPREGRAAEVADVGADVGPEAGFDVHGDCIKPPARCAAAMWPEPEKSSRKRGFGCGVLTSKMSENSDTCELHTQAVF